MSLYKGDMSKVAMIASTVSSKMLKAVADYHKAHFEETLTGFKWIGNKAIDLTKAGYEVLFSYEEAIGFCIGTLVPDKDGIVAGACLAQLYTILNVKGQRFSEYLEEIYKK
jgi:phosphomannomutase